MSKAIHALTTPIAFAASDTASCYAVGANGWLPVIDHAGRGAASYVRFERFPRKIKATAAEATAFAAKVIAWRAHFAAYKLQKRQSIFHPRHFAEAAE